MRKVVVCSPCLTSTDNLTVISASDFILNEDIVFSCQTALHQLGDACKEAQVYQLAGHDIFHSLPGNVAISLRYVSLLCKIANV